jgi:hypothetical protein
MLCPHRCFPVLEYIGTQAVVASASTCCHASRAVLPSIMGAAGTCHLTMKCDLLLCVKCDVKRENNQASEDINLVVQGLVPGTHLST